MKKDWLLLLFLLEAGTVFAQTRLYPVKEGKLWGYINDSGRMVIPPQFEAAESFGYASYARAQKEGQLCLIDNTGRVIKAELSPDMNSILGELFLVEESSLVGIKNINDVWVLPPLYENICLVFLSDVPFFYLSNGSLHGLADKEGKLMLQPEFDTLFFEGKLIGGRKGDELYVYDESGSIQCKGRYDAIRSVSNRVYTLHRSDTVICYLPETGKMVFLPHISDYHDRVDGKIVLSDSLFSLGIIDREGNVISSCRYRSVVRSNDHYIIARRDSANALFDTLFNQLTPSCYAYIDGFDQGLALVRDINSGWWGMINREGKRVIPAIYRTITFSPGLVKAYRSNNNSIVSYEVTGDGKVEGAQQFNRVYTISIKNREITWSRSSDSFDYMMPMRGTGWYRDSSRGTWGWKDSSGNTRISPVFDEVRVSQSNNLTIAIIRRDALSTVYLGGIPMYFNERMALVDHARGRVLLKPVYVLIDSAILDSCDDCYYRVLHANGIFKLINKEMKMLPVNAMIIDKAASGIYRVFNGEIILSGYWRGDPANSFMDMFGLKGSWVNYDVMRGNGNIKEIRNPSWRYITLQGKVLPGKFEKAERFAKTSAIVAAKGKYGLIDKEGNFLLPLIYDGINYLPDSDKSTLVLKSHNGLSGYINRSGEMITGLQYRECWPFHDGAGRVLLPSGKFAYVNTFGQQLSDSGFTGAMSFSDGTGNVRFGSKWGVIDTAGTLIIEPRYHKIEPFNGGYALARNRSSWYVIDMQGGETSIPYLPVKGFSYGMAPVSEGNRYGFINTAGELVLNCSYRSVGSFDNRGNCIVTRKKTGLVSSTGKTVIPVKYEDVIRAGENTYAALKKNRIVFYDAGGNKLNTVYGFSIGRFHDGTASVHLLFSEDYVNDSGRVMITGYRACRDFNYGLAVVGNGRNTMVLDKKGNKKYITGFYLPRKVLNENLLFARDNSRSVGVVINMNGEVVVDSADEAQVMDSVSRLIAVKRSGRWGFMTENGVWVIEPRFGKVGTFSEGICKVTTLFSYELADENGNILTPFPAESLDDKGGSVYQLSFGNSISYYSAGRGWLWNK